MNYALYYCRNVLEKGVFKSNKEFKSALHLTGFHHLSESD